MRLLSLPGPIAEGELPAALGQRIGLSGAPAMAQVLDQLRIRGDKDVLELLNGG